MTSARSASSSGARPGRVTALTAGATPGLDALAAVPPAAAATTLMVVRRRAGRPAHCA